MSVMTKNAILVLERQVRRWLRTLQRLHCSAYNYVKLAKIGNVRSSYYRARVLTTRTEVCIKDCMPSSGPGDVEVDGFAPR